MIELILDYKNFTKTPINQEVVENTLLAALSKLKKQGIFEISVSICGNAKIRQLNKKYRGIDKPTDVLSFGQTNFFPRKKQPRFLGDIVISAVQTKKQAKKFNVSFIDEFQKLLAHGLKHLLGIHHK